MNSDKSDIMIAYFDKWDEDVNRAGYLLSANDFFIEGTLVLACYIGALAHLRYPSEKDWKSYKRIVSEYSGFPDIYDNIDLLFFAQWTKSRLAKDSIYCKLKNYSELLSLLRCHFGDDETIKESQVRYQKRTELIRLIMNSNAPWFDETNFAKFIELFSNNQILYQFLRCDAVHNSSFPLFNSSYDPKNNKVTYTDNHQITREVLLRTVKNILMNLKNECIANGKWPYEL